MAQIRGRDTLLELQFRSMLHRLGFRFRLHRKGLPCKPDLILPGYHTVVFVHGCYWHLHGCKDSGIPKSNSLFWADKFTANRTRDARNIEMLEKAGWNVLVVWGCELKKPDVLAERLLQFFGNIALK